MSYVIYNKETTKILRVYKSGYWQNSYFATERAAKAGLTRASKKPQNYSSAVAFNVNDWAIIASSEFSEIEKQVGVKNLMTGQIVVQSVNTPRCCDVSSEAYWSM